MTDTTKHTRAAKHAAFNQGYRDGINGLAANTDGLAPELAIYYAAGHEEAYPKRLIPTYLPSPSGPVRSMVSLEHAAFLLSANRKVPGGRR